MAPVEVKAEETPSREDILRALGTGTLKYVPPVFDYPRKKTPDEIKNATSNVEEARSQSHAKLVKLLADANIELVSGGEDVPLIDLSALLLVPNNCESPEEVILQQKRVKEDMVKAAKEWGFFQVINHGVAEDVSEKYREAFVQLFELSFDQKLKVTGIESPQHGYVAGGLSSANKLNSVSLNWSEAYTFFRRQLRIYSQMVYSGDEAQAENLRRTLGDFSAEMHKVGVLILRILGEAIGEDPAKSMADKCGPTSNSTIRLSYYPACPNPAQTIGAFPHADPHCLTILGQHNNVEALRVLKNGRWVSVKPVPGAFVINIGDPYQIYSNDIYESGLHSVVPTTQTRHSTAYFLSPERNSIISPPQEVLDSSPHPRVFRPGISLADLYTNLFKHRNMGKSNVEHFKLKPQLEQFGIFSPPPDAAALAYKFRSSSLQSSVKS